MSSDPDPGILLIPDPDILQNPDPNPGCYGAESEFNQGPGPSWGFFLQTTIRTLRRNFFIFPYSEDNFGLPGSGSNPQESVWTYAVYLVGYGGDGEEQGGSHRHSQGEGAAPHRYLNK